MINDTLNLKKPAVRSCTLPHIAKVAACEAGTPMTEDSFLLKRFLFQQDSANIPEKCTVL